MLQLQYYNSILKNNHINKILDNYKIKYSLFVNEIESKVNEMMKLFLNDILVFLQNIEEVAGQKHKISEYDKNKKELELIRMKLKNKAYNENKLKNELDVLQQENNILKLKIKSLNEKIFNLSSFNSCTSQNVSPIRKTSTLATRARNSTSMPKKFNDNMTPKDKKQNNLFIVLNNTSLTEKNSHKSSQSLTISKSPKKKLKKSDKNVRDFRENTEKKSKTKPSSKLKISSEKINKNTKYNNAKNKKVNTKKFVKFVNHKTNKNNINKKLPINNNEVNKLAKSFDKRKDNSFPKTESINNKSSIKKDKNINVSADNFNSNNEEFKNYNNRYSPMNTLNQSIEIPFSNLNIDYEEIDKKINSALDDELKELEKDEENIELLLDQLIIENEDNEN